MDHVPAAYSIGMMSTVVVLSTDGMAAVKCLVTAGALVVRMPTRVEAERGAILGRAAGASGDTEPEGSMFGYETMRRADGAGTVFSIVLKRHRSLEPPARPGFWSIRYMCHPVWLSYPSLWSTSELRASCHVFSAAAVTSDGACLCGRSMGGFLGLVGCCSVGRLATLLSIGFSATPRHLDLGSDSAARCAGARRDPRS